MNNPMENGRLSGWWHIGYISLVFLVVLIAVMVCMSRGAIDRSAMDNVSFASSVVSIVLAVVSILVSIWASMDTGRNLGSMKALEGKLSDAAAKIEAVSRQAADNGRKIDSLLTRDNPLDNKLKSGKSFTMVGHASDIGKSPQSKKPVNYAALESEALTDLESTLGVTFQRDYKIIGSAGLTLDGYAALPAGGSMMVEVKIGYRKNLILQGLNRFLSRLWRALGDVDTSHLSVILLAVCMDDNSEEVCDFLRDNLTSVPLNITVVALNASDLASQPHHSPRQAQ